MIRRFFATKVVRVLSNSALILQGLVHIPLKSRRLLARCGRRSIRRVNNQPLKPGHPTRRLRYVRARGAAQSSKEQSHGKYKGYASFRQRDALRSGSGYDPAERDGPALWRWAAVRERPAFGQWPAVWQWPAFEPGRPARRHWRLFRWQHVQRNESLSFDPASRLQPIRSSAFKEQGPRFR